MADLAAIVKEVARAEVALALDTGHAHLVDSPGSEARATRGLLRTTHVHDNEGRSDIHLPPGMGTIDWPAWVDALDEIEYAGPIMLECIRYIRDNPHCLTDEFLETIQSMAGID
jgi:sugar phosphate isomerase/epimerase